MRQVRIDPHDRRRAGFTILEVLIALTASLLLMLGLARAYKLLGDKVTERQSEMELSSRLRDISIRLRDELRGATCEMTPPAKVEGAEGYLVYHEGPFTDVTGILGSVPHPTPDSIKFFPDSRFGDFDDYLAFTTRAKEGAPFMGFIPRGVLDAIRFMNMPIAQRALITGPYVTNPNHGTELVPFYSQVAEVAYWVSPQWARNPNGTLMYDTQVADGSGNFSLHPVYLDRNEDLLPDKLNLHRRVLLVRPDLNVTPAEMSVANGAGVPTPTPPTWNIPTIPFLIWNSTLSRFEVVPISDVNAANVALFPEGGSIIAPGLWEDSVNTALQYTDSPNWLAGVARVQQVMDLSISRVTDSWSLPESSQATIGTYGMPTSILKANSLAELTRPENRFAHVRIPQSMLSGQPGSSMPQIALAPPHPYLIAREVSPAALPDAQHPLAQAATAPTTFPHQADEPANNGHGATPYLSRYGRFTMTTFVRPEFNLADRVDDGGAGGTSVARVNRGGSDIIATDVVGFNVQVYDPSAPRFVWMGNDAVAGTAADDDLDSTLDDADELGWPGSDDESVSVNDPRIDEVFVGNGNRLIGNWNQTPVQPFATVNRGDFVDLGYMRLAGGPMRSLIQFDEQGNSITPLLTGVIADQFVSPFSGFANTPTVTVPGAPPTVYTSFFPLQWERSGRMVIDSLNDGRLSSFYQPVYDTWSDSYATDPFDQEGLGFGTATGSGYAVEVGLATPGVAGLEETRSTQITPSNAAPGEIVNTRNIVVRRWTSLDGSYINAGRFSDQNAGAGQSNNQSSTSPLPVTPPVSEPLRAIRISIRLNDFTAETIRQQTVIQEF